MMPTWGLGQQRWDTVVTLGHSSNLLGLRFLICEMGRTHQDALRNQIRELESVNLLYSII